MADPRTLRSVLLILTVVAVASCVTVKQSFNTQLLPEFKEAGVVAGKEIPLEFLDHWMAEHAEELKTVDPKKQKRWALFWLEQSEVILARTWWEAADFKPNFSDFLVINIATGETNLPDEDESANLTEMLEEIVERRTKDSAEDTTKTVLLTALSFLAGSGQIHQFTSFEGTIRNLTTGKELEYGIKIYNQYSNVTFINEDEDRYEHRIHVPRSEMYLAPDGNYVYFPYGYLVEVTKPDAGQKVWSGYGGLVTSSPDPGWTRLGMLETNEDGKYVFRIARFVLPEEEEI